MKKNHSKYTSDLPRKIYTFFLNYEGAGAPSFSKFARSIGVTLTDVEEYRKHREFDRAYTECSEIRRDYLIDHALCRQFDGSFVKFLLGEEGKCDEGNGDDGALEVVLTVVDG